MRAAMYLSHFQLPKCQIHTISGSLWQKVHNFSTRGETIAKFQLLSPQIYNLQGGHNRKWSRKSLSTNTEGKNTLSRKTNNIGQQISDVTSLTHESLVTSRVDISECKSSIHIEENITENKEKLKPTTIIVFDIETTGFNNGKERIIEIALQDLSGGVNSTFQTLVNPDKNVMNSHIHGISNYMVDKPGVPRMKELIPILIQYVKSRQKPGGQVILIAHNGKSFDVPFLITEFSRYNYEMPPNWLFIDTMPLARELMKLEGSNLSSKSLQALREYYKIPITGKAHRAMEDVKVLALVLQRLTRDLKLTIPTLVQNYTFSASDTSSNSKKKSSEIK